MYDAESKLEDERWNQRLDRLTAELTMSSDNDIEEAEREDERRREREERDAREARERSRRIEIHRVASPKMDRRHGGLLDR
jgi:hypothetical protein